VPQPEDWTAMRERDIELLLERTGKGLETWNRRVLETGIEDEDALRKWLTDEGVAGYPQMLLMMERFGYPDFLLATADQLIDAQYASRPALRPILDRILVLAHSLGGVTVQARKGYVSLVSPHRQFAAVKAATRDRVDLGLRLDGERPGGRLETVKSGFGGSINLKVALRALADVDNEVVSILERAYGASS
jgi:hypothetical protein